MGNSEEVNNEVDNEEPTTNGNVEENEEEQNEKEDAGQGNENEDTKSKAPGQPIVMMMKWANETEEEEEEKEDKDDEDNEEKNEEKEEDGEGEEQNTEGDKEDKEENGEEVDKEEGDEEKGEEEEEETEAGEGADKDNENATEFEGGVEEEKSDDEEGSEKGEKEKSDGKDNGDKADEMEVEGEPTEGAADGDNIEMDGEPELEEDDTNGYKEDESDPDVSDGDFEPATVEYPESKKKKKRKRVASDSDFDEEFEEYSPKRGSRSRAPKKKKSKSIKNKKMPKKNIPLDTMFKCPEPDCDFASETIGELKIHLHEVHGGDKPTYMDMAEAIIVKLNEKYGSSRTTIIKNIMTEYGHHIEVNQNQAKAILKRSLDKGLKIGRVRNGTLGKTGYLNIWLPNKDKRKTNLRKYNKNPKTLQVEDVPEEQFKREQRSRRGDLDVINTKNIKEQRSRRGASYAEDYEDEESDTVFMPRLLPRGGADRSSRSAARSGKRGRPGPKSAAKDDDEIAVVEEKLTPLAKMKAKAYANAKAALAKKLPASFLKSGTTRMVRIGPGGVVRSEEGKIVTTLGRLTGSTLVSPHNKKKMAVSAEQEAKMKAAAALASRKTVTSNPLFRGDDDDDDDLTCNMCLSSFWYKQELIDHMKNTHNVENPAKHIKAKF